MKKNGFTLIELLTVVVILGIIMALAIPNLRNLTYNSSEKKYQYHQKMVHEAAKLYAKNYRGELNSMDSSCINIPYELLLKEGLIEEEDITCSGNVILEKRSNDGYNYNYYLTCKDETGKVIHESEGVPLYCKGVGGKFTLDYSLYKDSDTTQVSYSEGEWARYIYGEYNASSPYNYPVSRMEYSTDFINWIPISNKKQTYTNYSGNIFVRAVDEGGNVSDAVRHLVRGDSLGPVFALDYDENKMKENDSILVSIGSVQDSGVGVDLTGNIYSFDGSNWESSVTRDFAIGSESTIYVKDKLGNIAAQPVQVIRACSGTGATATSEDILNGKTAWVNGNLVTGSMPNRGELNWKPTSGTTYTVPPGYYSGGTLDSSVVYNEAYNKGVEDGKSSSNITIIDLGSVNVGPRPSSESYDLVSLGYDVTNVTNDNFYAELSITVLDDSSTGREVLDVSHTYSNGVVTFNFNGSHNGANTSLSAVATLKFIKIG